MNQPLNALAILLMLSAGCHTAQAEAAPAGHAANTALPETPVAESPAAETPATAPEHTAAGDATPAAAKAGAADTDQPLTPDAPVDQILRALQASGRDLNDFAADVTMEEMDNVTGALRKRTGTVWYVRSPDGAVRMRLSLDRLIDDRGALNRRIEYLLKDGWLTDRDYTSRVEVARQVLRPGERIDLLKLGEGPFPLPIGQDPAEVKKQFEVSRVPAEQDVLPEETGRVRNTIRLRLVPRPGTQFERSFAAIDVWISPETRFPQRIMTTSDSSVQTTDLANLRVNQGIADDRFDLEDIAADNWNRRSEPFQQ